ncbi:MAG: transposase, partial [Succinivibrionaceae bacterium]|nr:transposase [Succinivibrionaceae bacterium]
NKYGTVWEKTLLNRIKNFKEPYFMWVEDFNLPTTNNLSERGLRGVKSHMKISGQFEYNFPNSYRLYPNWEVFALTQWKLIR